MANPEVLNFAIEVYPVERVKNPVIKIFLIIGIFILFLFGSEIWAYYQAHQDINPILHRYQGEFIYFISIVIFMLWMTSKINDRLPESFEVNADGITQVDRYGHRLNIVWDEIETITKGRGIRKLGLECPKAKKRIFIPGHMAGYGQLSARIFAEYEKRHQTVEPTFQNYALTPSGLRTYWIVGGFMALLALGELVFGLMPGTFFAHAHGLFFLRILVFTAFIMFSLVAYHIFRQAVRISGNTLELSAQGIAQINRLGKRVFIDWDEIGSLNPTPWVSSTQIEIRDYSRQKLIPIFNGYERFENLKERVFEEFMANLKVPPFPVVLGKTMITRQLISLAFVFILLCLFGYVLLFKTDSSIPGNQTTGFIIFSFFIVGFGFMQRFALRRVDRVTLDTPGITLHRLAGNQFISWENFDKAEWKSPKGAIQDIPYINLQLSDRTGKTYQIFCGTDCLLKLFVILNKK